MTRMPNDAAGRPRARPRDRAPWRNRQTESEAIGHAIGRHWSARLDVAQRHVGAYLGHPGHPHAAGEAGVGTWAESAVPEQLTGPREDSPARDIEGAPLGPAEAIRSGLRNMLRRSGRASRSAFCWFTLFNASALIALILLVCLVGAITPPGMQDRLLNQEVGVTLVLLVPPCIAQMTLGMRRLRDAGLPPGFLGLTLIPKVGDVVFIILLFAMALLPSRQPNGFQAPQPRGGD